MPNNEGFEEKPEQTNADRSSVMNNQQSEENDIIRDENNGSLTDAAEEATAEASEESPAGTASEENPAKAEPAGVTDTAEDEQNSGGTNTPAIKKRLNVFLVLRIICGIGFLVFSCLFINEVFIQPWRMNRAVDLTRDLYLKPSGIPTASISVPTGAPEITKAPVKAAAPTEVPTRDEQGRLLTFQELLAKNEDTKGWITIPGTNIDYVVMQNQDDPQYYLTRDFNREKQKAGCLFLDQNSSVEQHTTNLVIHGHNMKSTDNMFHYIAKFKKLDYFKEHLTFSFDTIYQTGQWKIFSIFITNGSDRKEPFFNYTQATFKDSSQYLNFLYQLRIRSLFNTDTVDLNENDRIVTLSTCSYEIYDYRTVIAARMVRPGEDITVDAKSITHNPAPLYPSTYYKNYGGEAPELPATFEEAMEQDLIKWYKPVEE